MKLAKSHVFWSSLTQLGGRCDCDSVQRETRKLDVHFRRENQHVRSTHFWKKSFFVCDELLRHDVIYQTLQPYSKAHEDYSHGEQILRRVLVSSFHLCNCYYSL